MEEAPPPTDHVLRPYHVALLSILILSFKEPDCKRIPPAFLLHIYRTLLNEISEVCRPKSYQELIGAICEGPAAEVDGSQAMIAAIKAAHIDLKAAEQITNFFGNLPSLFIEKNEEEPPVLMRRSIFGYFCRRCFVSFIKLSFSGVMKLQRDYQAWCLGDSCAGYDPILKDQLENSDSLIFKTQADKKTWAKPDTYEVWEKAHMTGDENIASENLRRFFEQHFHENNDSGVRQHALLNLVRMHYLRDEIAAASQLLTEAISVARTSGDRSTLQHCISMLHRLPAMTSSQRPALNEVQPDLHPLEVLFDVKKLIDPQNGQPLNAAFAKVNQAIGLYDQWSEVHGGLPLEEQWAQHMVQSVVWETAGYSQLASIEEASVIVFTDAGGGDNNRITAFLNRAHRLARQGSYDQALAMLLDPEVWRGLSLNDYTAWSLEVWHILVLRATRRGQDRMYREYLLPRRPPVIYEPKEEVFDAVQTPADNIHDFLREVIQMRHCDQAASSIEQLLKALWHSEFLTRFGDYRTGLVLLADVSLEFGLAKRSHRILEEILPQVINGSDLEQRAFACFTYGRALIASKGSNVSTLKEALSYLSAAEADYRTLQMYDSLMDTQYLLSVVCHNLGMTQETEEAAKQHFETQEQKESLGASVVEVDIQRIFRIIESIGTALASRE